MSVEKIKPLNNIELGLIDAKNGKLAFEDFMKVLLSSKLLMPSLEQISKDLPAMHPITFDRDGIRMAAVFTHWDRILKHKDVIKDVLEMKGEALFRQIPEGYGIVINPGFDQGLEILPHGISKVLKDFATKSIGPE